MVDISDLETIENLCWGLTFFGTGGGGRIEAGLDMLTPAVRAGRRLSLVGADELPMTPGRAGRSSSADAIRTSLRRMTNWRVRTRARAISDNCPTSCRICRELSAHAGVNVGALVSLELSSAATAATNSRVSSWHPNARRGLCRPRHPQLVLTKMELLGMPPTPVVMVDRWGNKVRITHAVGAAMVDRLGRMVSRAA